MTDTEALQAVLKTSVRRNGEKPLTNLYLLNIINMANEVKARHEAALDAYLNEALAEDRKWGA